MNISTFLASNTMFARQRTVKLDNEVKNFIQAFFRPDAFLFVIWIDKKIDMNVTVTGMPKVDIRYLIVPSE